MHAASTLATRARPAAQRGVSLVEAIVAMAVMAFGMMAIVALQASLRLNSDVAKQRSEAVRIGQEAIEAWRGFAAMPATANVADYADIATAAASSAAGYTTNTEYLLTRTVTDVPAQGFKSLQVIVSWEDRTGLEQTVTLNTIIAAADPALSGILSLQPSGAPVRQPLGRNPGIPRIAKDLGDGTSGFKPPGTGGATIVWVFNNLTGVIISVCSVSATTPNSALILSDLFGCVAEESYRLAGFVRFSPGATPDALNPLGTQIDFHMLALASTADSSNGECFVEPVLSPPSTFTAYECRVARGSLGSWTGSTVLTLPLDLSLFEVCRYFTADIGNAGHPLVYVGLERSLGSQNFLVISEGVSCPVVAPAVTQAHQPPLALPAPP